MAIIPALPFQLQNGTTADATQVMADFNQILNSVNANAAKNGANSDITSLLGLTTPLAPSVGGTPVFIGGTSTGAANAQVVTPVVPTTFGLTVSYVVVFIAGFTNSGATTLNVAASGVKNVYQMTRAGPAAMVGGEIEAGQIVVVVYDGTQFQMVSPNANAALYDTAGDLVVPGALTSTGVFTQSSTAYEALPNGTTGQRPGSPAAGMFRYNSTLGTVEFYNGTAWAQPISANPIPGAFQNLAIKNNAGTPNTQIDVTASSATVATSTGIGYLLSTVSVTINFATTGANGLDTGAIAASTGYFFYLIYNPTTNTIAGLGSLSATAPTLPAGYTAFARFGASFTDVSSHFLRVIQKGRIAQYVVGTNPATTLILSSGLVGTYSQTSPIPTSVFLTGFVPTTASRALFMTAQDWKGIGSLANILLAPNTAWGGTNNGPTGSNGNIWPLHADTINKASISIWLTLEALSVAWTSSAAGGALGILAWEDNL